MTIVDIEISKFSLWQHYKGTVYEVLGVTSTSIRCCIPQQPVSFKVRHSESLLILNVYQTRIHSEIDQLKLGFTPNFPGLDILILVDPATSIINEHPHVIYHKYEDYSGEVWARPLGMFADTLDQATVKQYNLTHNLRFKYIRTLS